MYIIISMFALLICAHGQGNSGDLNSLLTELYGPLPTTSITPRPTDLSATINQLFGRPLASSTAPRQPDPYANLNRIFSRRPTTTTTPKPTGNRGPTTLAPAYVPCTKADGKVGECVPFYLCNNSSTIITDGRGVIDIRGGNQCPSYIYSCCVLEDKRPPEDPITQKPDPAEPPRAGCGWRNPEGAGMRTTGDVDGETKFGEFPWMVAILNDEPVIDREPDEQKLKDYVGGGSLIHPSVVLTAAHSIATARKLRVRAGEWDTQITEEPYPYQDRDVQSIEVHKDFNKENLYNDIALLFLATPMEMAPNVGVACLPPPREKTPSGTRCFATGWGKDKFGKEGRYQVILKKIELPVVDRNTCQTQLRKTRLGRFFELHTSFMCAGGEPGKDTCKGDGGSPLSCPIEFEKNRFMQSGIVAWGIGCGEDSTPGVYVDVASLRAWIDDKVAGKGYEPRTYDYLY